MQVTAQIAPPPGGRRRALPHVAAALFALVFARAQDLPASPDPTAVPPSVTITAQSPDAEMHFSGFSLKSVRADDAQNEIALDFNGPVSGNVFDTLQSQLPDWVKMAYSGYDSAVIRATRPVTFLTRPEGDGFSLRMVPRDATASAVSPGPMTLRGPIGVGAGAAAGSTTFAAGRAWHDTRHHYATALAERPTDDGLRRGYDLAFPHGDATAEVWGGQRKDHDGGTLSEAHAKVTAAVDDNLAVTGQLDDSFAHDKTVRRLDGSVASLNKNSISGGIGVAYLYPDGSQAKALVTYGPAGPGATLSVDTEDPSQQWSVKGVYHGTYADTAEAIADQAVRDQAEIDGAAELLDNLWGSAELHLTRYGVHGDANLAHTAGFTASLAYLLPVYDELTAGATYTADGEYTLGAHHYTGVSPTAFIPLSIRTREVHSLTGSLNTPLLDNVWIDGYGGYAIDRYGSQGALYGGAVRWALFPDFDIVLTASHTQVSDRQGETGPETQALLSLEYR